MADQLQPGGQGLACRLCGAHLRAVRLVPDVRPRGAFNVPSIFSQLGNGAWQDWNESMPSNCYKNAAGSDSTLNGYKPGHNPALYYAGLPCSTYGTPTGTTGPDDMSSFNTGLAAGTVPQYNLITPNMCEDGYHACN